MSYRRTLERNTATVLLHVVGEELTSLGKALRHNARAVAATLALAALAALALALLAAAAAALAAALALLAAAAAALLLAAAALLPALLALATTGPT